MKITDDIVKEEFKSKRYVLNLTLEFSIIMQYRQRVMYNRSKIIKGVYKDEERVC